MKCRNCGSARIYRSQRKGLKEGLFLRLFLMAPYRCRDCGMRYIDYSAHFKKAKGRDESLAEYIGLRGREYKLRQWTIGVVVTVLLILAATAFLLRILR
jgi:hypothetical protein